MSKNDSKSVKKTLFVDIGNSSVKVGFKEEGEWSHTTHRELPVAAAAINGMRDQPMQVVVSSVRRANRDKLLPMLGSQLIREITIADINLDKLDYETPQTLGIDRYLACLGAHTRSGKAVVVIDAGTACTIDYMDPDGIFRGGVIMPGFQMVMNCFHSTAPELPPVEIALPESFPGRSTTESLQWGQVGFYVDGVLSILQAYDTKFPDYELYLTGGDAAVLNQMLGAQGEIDYRLVMKGMEAHIAG